MQTIPLFALIIVAFSIWAAYCLMDAIHDKKATFRARLVYSISQWVFYVVASAMLTYLILLYMGLDNFQLVLLFVMFLLIFYVGCGFIYDILQINKIHNK